LKDRALIQREADGDRWHLTRDVLMRRFEQIAGLRTIELGAGRGDLSVLLAAHGAEVTLLDFSQKALDAAGQRFERLRVDAHQIKADLTRTGEQLQGAYDVALSVGVLEHMQGPDRLRAVRTHRQVLRPGGVAMISVPNAACIPYRLWKAYLQLRGWWPYGLEIPYSRGELLALGREAGFRDCHTACTAFLRSLGDQFCRTFLGWGPGWSDARSFLDRTMGLNLMLFGYASG
jgi:cyclopropane fatty-acyl-phospholipid synthase-like methyltransferase